MYLRSLICPEELANHVSQQVPLTDGERIARAESAAIQAGRDLEQVLGTLPQPRRRAVRYVLYQQFECLCRLLELDTVSR